MFSSILKKFLVACALFFVTPALTSIQAVECPEGCISTQECKAKTKGAKKKGKKKGKKSKKKKKGKKKKKMGKSR